MDIADKTYAVSPLKILRYLLKHMVPIFWGVSIIPFYMSWVFASEKLFPTYLWEFVPGSTSSGSYTEFAAFALALAAIGPFLGGSTLLYNDYWDSEVDKTSRRKALFPLPQGFISPKTVLFTSLVFIVLALLFSLLVSLLFFFIIAVCVLLSILYSTPPIRLKNKPGMDVFTNAFGSGLLCSIAGWIVVKPLVEYPWLWGATSMCGVAAIYIPTTIIDQESDKRAGINTFAVRLGKRKAFFFAVLSIVLANCLIIYMSLTGYLIDLGFLIVALPIAALQVIAYPLILRKLTFKSVYNTILILVILLVLGNGLLLLYYVGLWSP